MAIITCPSGCTTALPAVKFDKCAPKVNLSEIERIYVAKPTAAAFADWKLATEWTTRISETDSTGDDAIRPLIVIGDKPAPANVIKEISNGRKLPVRKDHTLNVTIDDVSDENYDFMRTLECGGQVKIWYETAGGYLYGGNEGIDATMVLDDVLNRGRDEIETLTGTITWSAKFHPERTLSAIAV